MVFFRPTFAYRKLTTPGFANRGRERGGDFMACFGQSEHKRGEYEN